jgi:hypothetical protein
MHFSFFVEIIQLLVDETNWYYKQYVEMLDKGPTSLCDMTAQEIYLFTAVILQMGHDQMKTNSHALNGIQTHGINVQVIKVYTSECMATGTSLYALTEECFWLCSRPHMYHHLQLVHDCRQNYVLLKIRCHVFTAASTKVTSLLGY